MKIEIKNVPNDLHNFVKQEFEKYYKFATDILNGFSSEIGYIYREPERGLLVRHRVKPELDKFNRSINSQIEFRMDTHDNLYAYVKGYEDSEIWWR